MLSPTSRTVSALIFSLILCSSSFFTNPLRKFGLYGLGLDENVVEEEVFFLKVAMLSSFLLINYYFD